MQLLVLKILQAYGFAEHRFHLFDARILAALIWLVVLQVIFHLGRNSCPIGVKRESMTTGNMFLFFFWGHKQMEVIAG